MRYKETIKRGISLLLVLVLAVSLIVPAAAVDGGRGAEMVAAFDKTSYSAGETVTVTFMVYGADFDAAGFHVTYDQSSLKYQSVQTGSGFTMPVCKAQESALELMVESDSVQQPASSGTVIAKVTFDAVTGGAKTLTFTSGSAAYLERKNAVVYNGYQALNVTAGVAVDAAADAALRQVKAAAVAQLETDINGKLEAGVTVAQRELLLRCLQSGRAAIHNAATQEAVKEALDEALAQAAKIAAETTLEFPKLTALYDAENNDSTTIGNMYPSFSPDATAYFLYNSRPINGIPRRFKGTTTSGVTVVFNGEAVSVAADGTFAFAVPFQALENCNTLVLTDENTGLSTTYAFYSFGNGVSGGFSNVKVYDEEGNAPGDKIQEARLSDSGSVTRFSSSIDRVRVGFDGSADANQECLIDLVDGNGRVLQSFTTASGDKAVSQTFLSDVIQLKKGTNCLLLRYHGVDKSKYEDGKPVETPAYRTKALVINYIDPGDSDPTLKDTELEKVELYIKGITSDAVPTESQEIKFQWKEKAETTPARWESTVELSPDDFNLGENLEYLSQVIHLCVDLKDGQEITVTGGNETPQPRTLLPDGSYHVADYYESFGSANKPTVMKKDAFTVTITVTAKDGIHKDTYFITVNKSGRAALVVPKVYQSRELLIVADRPIRNVPLPFDAVSITDAEGLPVNTARALEDGTLKIQITDPAVVSWDGEARNSGSIAVDLLKQGKTDIKLVYDDGALHLDGTTVLYVNYKINVLADARSDAADLWTDAKNGKRAYEDGAVDALKDAIQAANTVYDKYKDKDRRLMNQTQFDEINDAVNDLRAAIKTFQYKEIGVKIVEFDPLPDSVLYQVVAHETPRSELNLPAELGATVIDENGERSHINIEGVVWVEKPTWVDDDQHVIVDEYTFVFTAVLPAGHVPTEESGIPTINVTRKEPLRKFDMTKWFYPRGCPDDTLYVPVGTELSQIVDVICMETPVGNAGLGDSATVKVPTIWEDIDGFDGSKPGGPYRFKPTVDEKTLGENGMLFYWREGASEKERNKIMKVMVVTPPAIEITGLSRVSDIEVTLIMKEMEKGKEVERSREDITIFESQFANYPIPNCYDKDFVRLACEIIPQASVQTNDGEYTYNLVKDESELKSKTGENKSKYKIVYELESTSPENLTIIPDSLEMQVGETKQLTVKEADLLEGRGIAWRSGDPDIAGVDSGTGLVTAKKAGTATITATVKTDNGPISGIRTITVTPADPGGGGGGGTDDGSGNGGGGTLSGQTTSGGGDYRDLLTDPLPQQGSNGTNKSNANTAQGAQRPQAGTSQATGQKSETTTDAAGNGGDDAGSGTTGRVISVSKGDKSPGSAKELAVILISCSVLLAAGIFRGKKRGED